MAGRHPLGDLAPRDVVAAAMPSSGWPGGGPRRSPVAGRHRAGPGRAGARIPHRDRRVPGAGHRPGHRARSRSRPGAHYACGGIRAGMDGRTSVPGLYAVGEAASTGVHGANRLASNSLTEALIIGRRGREPARAGPAGAARAACGRPRRPGGGPGRPAGAGRGHVAARRSAPRRDGLERLRQALGRWPGPRAGALDLATVEATNLHAVSVAGRGGRPGPRGEPRLSSVAGRAPLAAAGRPRRHTIVRVEDGRPRVTGTVRATVGARE